MKNLKSLGIGKLFWFGTVTDSNNQRKRLMWRVIDKDDDKLFALSYFVVDLDTYNNKPDRNWERSRVRNWLNSLFYDNVFSDEEKKCIMTVKKDNVTLLTKKEAETLVSFNDRKCQREWWLRTPYSTLSDSFVCSVYKDGNIGHNYCNSLGGVRPAIYIDLNCFDDDTSDDKETEEYTIENGVLNYVGKYVEEAVIPQEVHTIRFNAFGGCSMLMKVTLPDTLKKVYGGMFFYCRNMETVCFKGTEIELNELKDPEQDLDNILNMLINDDFTIDFDFTVKFTYITDYYLAGNNAEAEKLIGKEFIKIAAAFIKAGYFRRLEQLIEKGKFLTSRNINKIIETALDKKAFGLIPLLLENKEKLSGFKYEEIEKFLKKAVGAPDITAKIIEYRDKYFSDDAIEKIKTDKYEKANGIVERTEKEWKEIFSFKVTDGCVTIRRYKGEDTDVVVPDMIGKNPVTVIGEYAFSPEKKGTKKEEKERFRNIVSVSLGKNIKEIGQFAFRGCTSLKNIDMPDSVSLIGWGVFWGCSSLEKMIFPASLTSIEFAVLRECPLIEEITIPNGVTKIGQNAFEGDTGLKKVVLNEELKKIDHYAFRKCSSLTEIIIPEGAEFLGYAVFGECTALEKIVVPESVTSIYKGCFDKTKWVEEIVSKNGIAVVNNILVEGSKELTEVVIPDGVTKVCWDAFKKGKLQKVIFPESIVTIEMDAFSDNYNLTEIILPAGATDVSDYAFNGCRRLSRIVIGDEEVDLSKFKIR